VLQLVAVVSTGGQELLQQVGELTLLIGLQRLEHAGESGIPRREPLRDYPPPRRRDFERYGAAVH
jgi:hypothetical protein